MPGQSRVTHASILWHTPQFLRIGVRQWILGELPSNCSKIFGQNLPVDRTAHTGPFTNLPKFSALTLKQKR